MLDVVSINDYEKWESIVRSFNLHDVYYLPNYVRAFELHGDGMPLLFFYKDNQMKAINVVMKRDISKDAYYADKIDVNTLFDLSTPYGYGGFVFEGEVTSLSIENLNKEYTEYCNNNNIVSEFVRIHPLNSNCEALNKMYEVSNTGPTVTMTLDSKEQIWNNFTSKNRNMVRKAEKNGVKIYCGLSPNLMREFTSMYYATMKKDEAKEYYYFNEKFFNSLLYDLNYNLLIFYAVWQNEIISMSLIIFSNSQLHYHLSASNREYQNLAPTNLLLYEVACWGESNGYKSFHLGGGLGGHEDNLLKFKKAFNKNSNSTFNVGRKIFDDERYQYLVGLKTCNSQKAEESGYFPLYRAPELE